MRVICTLHILCLGLIRSALLRWDATLLREVPIKDCPSAIATLCKVVASHDELQREIWLLNVLVGVLEFHTSFDGLDETVCVTWSTGALIFEVSGEVITLDVPQIELAGDLMIGDMIWRLVCFPESLSEGCSLLELFSLLTELLCSRKWMLLEFRGLLLFFLIIKPKDLHGSLESLVRNMIWIRLFFIGFFVKLALTKTGRLVEPWMRVREHAHVWLPRVMLLVVSHFNDSLVWFGRWLEALEEIASFPLCARHFLAPLSVSLCRLDSALRWLFLFLICLEKCCICLIGNHLGRQVVWQSDESSWYGEPTNLRLIHVTPILRGIHALDTMLLVSGQMRLVLNEARHSLITNRIELGFHEVVHIGECLWQLLEVPSDVLLDLISEGADESEIVFKLDDQGLIVDGQPVALDCLR